MIQRVLFSPSQSLLSIIETADEPAQRRFLHFLAVTIRNHHTRRSYALAVSEFLARCEARDAASLMRVQPFQVGSYIEELTRARSAPTAKQVLDPLVDLVDASAHFGRRSRSAGELSMPRPYRLKHASKSET